MAIEQRFDTAFVAALALREKQIQQNYRPIIAVHKWFARRPGTLFRALLLSEFSEEPLAQAFFKANDLAGRVIADPFMGGGTPLFEANRVGCDVLGFDINPMAAWIVREEIEHLDLCDYRRQAEDLIAGIEREVGDFYRTDCPRYGDRDVPVKYFLWVKVTTCEQCGADFDLFPGHLLADDTRHPRNVLICPQCGELSEVCDLARPGDCAACRTPLAVSGPARRNRCLCPQCGHVNRYPRPEAGCPRHRMFAIEYYNPRRKNAHAGRFFKKPDDADLRRAALAAERWAQHKPAFVPVEAVPPGDETDRLHRWGYRLFRELFNDRQLLGLELSAQAIAATADRRVRHALATNLSDLLRYQNMLCRYDTTALKSLDIFSVHGFPVGLVQCESNILGIANGRGMSVGSGGWRNIVEKYAKAKQYCSAPFEVRRHGRRKAIVPIAGEWIGEYREGARRRDVAIRCVSSTTLDLPPGTLDAVFTDPPYFGNVQYGELMEFCYVWLKRLAAADAEGFDRPTTRSRDELTGNATQERGLVQFTDGMSQVFCAMATALKPGAPLAFTFHHNRIEAYTAIAVAILDAGLVCTATLPCPAEMGGSIHIHGTDSSILDTVFVCRPQAVAPPGALPTERAIEDAVLAEARQLARGGVKPSAGDVRCMVFGHLTRHAMAAVQARWERDLPTPDRLARCAAAIAALAAADRLAESAYARHKDAAARRDRSLPLFCEEEGDAVPL
jgi:adenine-specific DNA methylase